jgi:ubiquinone/menaquinone biosynthesis C-methylase UbiE
MIRMRDRFLPVLLPLAIAAAIGTWQGHATAQSAPRGRLFPPEELGQLEGPDRDEWQQPERVMDSLGIADGSRVADIGAGGGWFTIRLAHRVGPNGIVYAEDVQAPMIDAIKRRVEREGLHNVMPILGGFTDPHLMPGSVQAALLVGLYPQIQDPVSLLKNVRNALTANGRLGIIDFKPGGFGPGPDDNRVPPETVIRDAATAGLRLVLHEKYLRYQYLLVFAPNREARALSVTGRVGGAPRKLKEVREARALSVTPRGGRAPQATAKPSASARALSVTRRGGGAPRH